MWIKSSFVRKIIFSWVLLFCNIGINVLHVSTLSCKPSSTNCILNSFNPRYSVVILYAVVDGMEQVDAMARILDCGFSWMTIRTSSLFCFVILGGLSRCSRSSPLPVSQKRTNVRLMQASVGLFLPNSTYSFRLTTTGDSNLAINRTIFILRLIGIDI